jgi:hypothetical protein
MTILNFVESINIFSITAQSWNKVIQTVEKFKSIEVTTAADDAAAAAAVVVVVVAAAAVAFAAAHTSVAVLPPLLLTAVGPVLKSSVP